MMGFVRERGGEFALLGLAGFSLLAMVFVVRKAGEASKFKDRRGELTNLEDLEIPVPPEVPTVGSSPLGGEGEVLLGHELDQEQLHSAQVAEQVNKMVEDNPAGAAALVDHWMNEPG